MVLSVLTNHQPSGFPADIDLDAARTGAPRDPMAPPPYIYASTLSRRDRVWRGRRRHGPRLIDAGFTLVIGATALIVVLGTHLVG